VKNKTKNNDLFNNQVNGEIFNDLLNNKFDLAWHYGREKNKKYSIVPPENNTEDDGTVIYEYNSELFRSEEFIKSHKGQHILFSGCSESEGVGGNIEDSWTNMLYKKISKEMECSGYFNLSRAGWGWNRIILNSLIYFKKYGYPNIMFILLPNIQRKFDYSIDGHLNDQGDYMGNWKYIQKYPMDSSLKNLDPKDLRIFSSPKEYNEDFVNFLISWKIFNKVCSDNNIKLFFSTWDPMDCKNLINLNIFENFLPVNDYNETKYISQYYASNSKKNTDIFKRDGHSGRLTHFIWTEKFYEKYKEQI
jgi:hypothetical protein